MLLSSLTGIRPQAPPEAAFRPRQSPFEGLLPDSEHWPERSGARPQSARGACTRSDANSGEQRCGVVLCDAATPISHLSGHHGPRLPQNASPHSHHGHHSRLPTASRVPHSSPRPGTPPAPPALGLGARAPPRVGAQPPSPLRPPIAGRLWQPQVQPRCPVGTVPIPTLPLPRPHTHLPSPLTLGAPPA